MPSKLSVAIALTCAADVAGFCEVIWLDLVES